MLTEVQGIGDAGQIVGSYYKADMVVHAFLHDETGLNTLDAPGASATQAYGVNAGGEVVGAAVTSSTIGFLRTSTAFRLLSSAGAVFTQANGINKHNTIAGSYLALDGSQHGFQIEGNTVARIDYPQATATQVFGINDNGDVVGTYVIAGLRYGFLLSNGVFTTINVPGSFSTQANGINNAGQIVGNYLSTGGATSGFLLSNGVFTSLDFPGATYTTATGINNSGVIVGYSTSGSLSALVTQGFYATGANLASAPQPE